MNAFVIEEHYEHKIGRYGFRVRLGEEEATFMMGNGAGNGTFYFDGKLSESMIDVLSNAVPALIEEDHPIISMYGANIISAINSQLPSNDEQGENTDRRLKKKLTQYLRPARSTDFRKSQSVPQFKALGLEWDVNERGKVKIWHISNPGNRVYVGMNPTCPRGGRNFVSELVNILLIPAIREDKIPEYESILNARR